MNLQDILEIHRVTCGENDCSPEQITQPVAIASAHQVMQQEDGDSTIGMVLMTHAEDMDQPVALWQIRATLQKLGIQ